MDDDRFSKPLRQIDVPLEHEGPVPVVLPEHGDARLEYKIVTAGGIDDRQARVEGDVQVALNASTNGSFNSASYDGVFDNNFGLQVTTDGSTWTSVSGWSFSPGQ